MLLKNFNPKLPRQTPSFGMGIGVGSTEMPVWPRCRRSFQQRLRIADCASANCTADRASRFEPVATAQRDRRRFHGES